VLNTETPNLETDHDYSGYDRPTVIRKQGMKAVPSTPGSQNPEDSVQKDDINLLDIPAFLRRQAD
jgi:hypothetical protein